MIETRGGEGGARWGGSGTAPNRSSRSCGRPKSSWPWGHGSLTRKGGRTATRRDELDVCVVGAGDGVMIQELTAARLRVVALQRGPFLKPGDFDDDELRTVIHDQVFSPDQIETWHFDENSSAEIGKFNMTAKLLRREQLAHRHQKRRQGSLQ